jgi:hypothetical protein
MKPFLLIFVALFCTTLLMAQDKSKYGTPEERATLVTDRMKSELPLREEQYAPIYKINLHYAKIVQKDIIDPGLSQWASYNKVMKINAQKEKELKPLLTENQFQAYQKMKSEAMQKMLLHPGGGIAEAKK